MSDQATSIAALVSHLVSLGHSGQSLVDILRLAETAFGTSRSRGSEADRRERERVRKADWRTRNPGHVPGQKADPISSNTVDKTLIKKERKKEPEFYVPGQSGTSDDWPEDFLEQFWKAFPPFRRQAKAKVGAKLARIRSDGKVTWAALFEGVLKFARTNPGEYAPAPMVWLNDGRWDREYGSQQGGSNEANRSGGAGGKVGFAGVAARLRERADGQLPIDEPTGHPGR